MQLHASRAAKLIVVHELRLVVKFRLKILQNFILSFFSLERCQQITPFVNPKAVYLEDEISIHSLLIVHRLILLQSPYNAGQQTLTSSLCTKSVKRGSSAVAGNMTSHLRSDPFPSERRTVSLRNCQDITQIANKNFCSKITSDSSEVPRLTEHSVDSLNIYELLRMLNYSAPSSRICDLSFLFLR